jgi:uncharacterized membrane protein YkoI
MKSEVKTPQIIQISSEAITTSKPEPVEIEIKKSSEAQRVEGCKDLCGDGICQEVVCMAIGCPCPETPTSCPQDCNFSLPAKAIPPLPVISLPAETKLVIDPAKPELISVNDRAVKFTEMNTTVLPKISVEVETKTLPTKVEIYVDKENKTIRIEHENVSAITREVIKVEEKSIKIETPKRMIEVNVLPSVATQIAISTLPQEIKSTELKVMDERAIYEIEGIKAGRLLWLIPVNFSVQTYVDAQTENIVRMEKPWWSFLVS